MALAGLVLGSLILYLKGMRIMMFQLSGFYFTFLVVLLPLTKLSQKRRLLFARPIWEFPKIMGPYFGVLIIKGTLMGT